MSETIQFYAYSPTTTIIIKPCNYMKICSLDLQQSETTGQIRGQHIIRSTPPIALGMRPSTSFGNNTEVIKGSDWLNIIELRDVVIFNKVKRNEKFAFPGTAALLEIC